MIHTILSQTNPLSQAVNDVYLQYGALAFLALMAFIIVFRIWQNSETARTKALEVENSRKIEDTKRDTLISDLAEKQGKTSDELRQVVVELAESRGQVKLLDSQLQNERDKRQKEAIDFSERFTLISKQYEDLKTDHNGKTVMIASQDLEISQLNAQVKEWESKHSQVQNKLSEVTKSLDAANDKIAEQAATIIELRQEVASSPTQSKLDATIPIPEMAKITTVTTVTASIESPDIGDSSKEFTNLDEKDS